MDKPTDQMKAAFDAAGKEIGVVEWANGSNPRIVAYAKESGNDWISDDDVPWCATFVGAMLARGGLKGTGKANARSYLEWGVPVDIADARPGDVVVYSRGTPKGWTGHVGFFVKQTESHILTRGGNQSDAVIERNYPKARLLGVRRAPQAPQVVFRAPSAEKQKVAPSGGLWALLARILKGSKV